MVYVLRHDLSFCRLARTNPLQCWIYLLPLTHELLVLFSRKGFCEDVCNILVCVYVRVIDYLAGV